MMTSFLAFLLLSSASAQSPEEVRFNEIYKGFHSQPTDSEAWNRLVTPLASETYKIQPGDNLWVISEIFFGDGNYWPKVWSVNSRIQNPHLIEPGNSISFKLGTSAAEPSFLITEENTIPKEVEVTTIQGKPGAETSTAETSSFKPKPVIHDLPQSLPAWNVLSGSLDTDYDQWSVEIVPRPRLKFSEEVFLPSFVAETPIDFLGTVEEAQLDDEVMVQGKTIYVSLKAGVAQSGDKLLIVQDAGQLKYKDESSNTRKGHVVRVSGQVVLGGALDVKYPKSGIEYYKAYITKSLDLAIRGNRLIAGDLKKIDLNRPGRVSSESVKVIGGRLDDRGFQFGSGNIVYLDRGAINGVNEGDIFMIEKVKRKRFLEPEPLVKFTEFQSGQVQVLDVSDYFSTAIVLGGSSAIHPGDVSFN